MARVPTNPRDQRARERFFVEVAPGHVRLRHQLGLRTRFGRGRLGPLIDQVVRQLEDLEEAGESIEFNRFDPDEEAEILAAEEQERRENEELFLDTLDPDEVADYCGSKELETARKAAEERLGRGAKGMSERSRREVWRWVLSLPFEMLGDRPLWITFTYPGEWKQWVPDGRTLERHRRAFGEAWYRGFGERPVGSEQPAAGAGLATTDDRLVGAERAAEQLLPAIKQGVESRDQRWAGHDHPGPPLLAYPRDPGLGIVETEVTDP